MARVFWDLILDKISKRLDGWKKTFLFLSGRITLIQSCLSHIPSYFLSMYKIPTLVTTKIEKMKRDFLWLGFGVEKSDRLISWIQVCKPKEERRVEG